MALAVLAAGCAGTAAPDVAAPARTSTSAAPAPSADPSSVAPATRADTVVRPQVPSLVVLPGGRRVPVRAVGTTPAGLLAVPDDIDVAGWWRGGARIGDPFGSVLVAAHVDSTTQGLGPFAELLTAESGARLRVESAGLHQEFVIRERRLVPQGSLVDDSWIFDASGDLRLTLVTCAPPYDSSRGGYQNLAVVTALPLGPPETS
ncbi:class F sortase [Nocardioides oleivorans]|uniref:class F sortase n=1 Tax=Nocardioides oleivorans TaxID=273676 RepID=UPI0013EA9F8A|nr:class F sortase [Nocardioides oleivorans]